MHVRTGGEEADLDQIPAFGSRVTDMHRAVQILYEMYKELEGLPFLRLAGLRIQEYAAEVLDLAYDTAAGRAVFCLVPGLGQGNIDVVPGSATRKRPMLIGPY